MPARRLLLVLVLALAVLLVGVRTWVERESGVPLPADDVQARAASGAAGVEGVVAGSHASAAAEGSAIDAPLAGDDPPRVRAQPGAAPRGARGPRAGFASVRGRVEDAAGAAVPNAELVFEGAARPAAGEGADLGGLVDFASYDEVDGRFVARFGLPVPVTADERGRFAAEELAPGPWRLVAVAPGFERARVDLGVLEAGRAQDDVVVRLARTPIVRVRVTWPDGRPVPDARVAYRPLFRSMFTVEQLGRLSHRASGRPMLGEREVRRDADGLDPEPGAGVTGDDGVVELAAPSFGGWTVTATARRLVGDGQGFAVPDDVAALLRGNELVWRGEASGEGAVPAELALVLAPSPSLLGRVVDARGAPLAGARVVARVRAEAEEDVAYDVGSAQSDAQGVFELRGLRGGKVALDVEREPEFAARVEELELDATLQRRDVVLARRPALAGVVRDVRGNVRPRGRVTVVSSGLARPGERAGRGEDPQADEVLRRLGVTRVDLEHNRNGIADDEGRFRFEQLPLGWTRLVATGDDALPSLPLDVLVAGDEDQLALELRLRDGAAVEGHARGKDGEPLARRIVHFFPEGDEEHAQSALTDALGLFRLQHLEPGRWTFRMPLADAPDDADHAPPDATTDARAKELLTETVALVDGRTTRVTLAPD